MSSSDGVRREVAWRLFAREYNDSDMSFKEGDDERAPNYVVSPSAAKVNRVFVVGVATEVDEVGDDYYRVRVSDPTGTFMVYAGQYQPDAVSFFRELQPPEYVSVVGKSRTYQPDDSDDVYTSIRPEEVNTADEDTRDRWNLEAARQTIERAEAMQMYLKGDGGRVESHRPRLHDPGATAEHYDLTLDYLEELRKQAYQVVAELAGVDADLSELEEVEVDAEAASAGTPSAGEADDEAGEFDVEPESVEAAEFEAVAEADDEAAAEGDAAAELPGAQTAEPEPEGGDAETIKPESDAADADAEASDAETDAGEPDTGVASADTVDAGETTSEAVTSPSEPEATDASESEAADLEEEFADVDSEDAEWEWDEGERERVEEEFGGEFDTAAELESEDDESTAGDAAESTSEADARELGEAEQSEEPPDDVDDEPPASAEAEAEVEPGRPADSAEEPDAEDTDLEPEAAADMAEESADSAETTEADAAAEDADAEAVVMEVLEEHDDGDGVSRGDIRSYAGERGVSEEAAEEAIEQLLLEGMCYPSDGDRIKPL